jgi:hypothetical protein
MVKRITGSSIFLDLYLYLLYQSMLLYFGRILTPWVYVYIATQHIRIRIEDVKDLVLHYMLNLQKPETFLYICV